MPLRGIDSFYSISLRRIAEEEKMIEECNFKSRIKHRDSAGCNLTPNEIVCTGEENCILYQIYKKLQI
jgi:hypothetical protein